MSTYATRVYQANFGYQISNLGILWVVLLIHILNAGYAFYGFANSGGGEVVLCFLALCLFSIGRWMCVCCTPPENDPVPRRKGMRKPRLALDNGMCPPAEPATRNYYADNDDDPLDEQNASVLSTVLYKYPNRNGNGNGNDPGSPGIYRASLPNEDFCGFSREGRKMYQSRKAAVGYTYTDDSWNIDNCDLNYQEPDTDRLQRGQKIEKPRIVPRDIDYYMPEAHFYNDMDNFPCECLGGEEMPKAKPADDGPVAVDCDSVEAARNRLNAQGKGLVGYRRVGGARSTASQLPYRLRPKPVIAPPPPEDEEEPTDSTVVNKTRIRSFSPIPPDGRW